MEQRLYSKQKKEKSKVTKNYQVIKKGRMASMGLCKSKLCGTTKKAKKMGEQRRKEK